MKKRFAFPMRFSREALLSGAVVWTVLIIISLYWNWHQVTRSTMALVAEEARSNFKKDVIYRLWNSKLGGVYVPVTKETPPNPYLKHLKERDITTPSGVTLTLINPAYMTRLVHKLGLERFGTRGHITSLRPIRPENAADEWEIYALQAFEAGSNEVISEEKMDGESYLRLMRPLVVEKNCLKCHARQGYKEHDIRGGISVSIPMSLYKKAAVTGLRPLLIGHLLIWLLGLAGIGSGNLLIHRVALSRRAEFEHIAGQISSEFIKLLPGNTDMGIKRALASAGDFTGVDRVYLFQFQNDRYRMVHTHEWCAKGIPPNGKTPVTLAPEDIPWMMAKLNHLRMIHIPVVANLPPEASAEKKMFDAKGVEGLFVVPLVLTSQLAGFLGAEVIRKGYTWSEEDLLFLQLVGETIVHALDRDRAEMALAHQTERLNRILQGTNVGTWEWNVQTGETILNDRWGEIIGYTLQELSPMSKEVLNRDCHNDDCTVAEELLQKCFDRKNEYYNCELRVRHKNGTWIWVQDRGKVITWTKNGKPEWMYGTRTDISEQKRQEEERQKMHEQLQQTQRLESLGILAGGIAHDFNNILMGISGYADLALDDLSPASPCRRNIGEIINASKRAAELCNQMLTYAGKKHLEKQNLSLRHLIEETLNMLKTSINKKHALHLRLIKILPDIFADPTQIRQILMNLVINASEAIGDQNGTVTISTGSVDFSQDYEKEGYIIEPTTRGPYVYFEVSDTGIGIDQTIVQSMFEPFFTTKFTGRGLGLSAVLGIVRGHDGALWIKSEPGKGAYFKVFFPAQMGSVENVSLTVAENTWHGEGTVLLVDDEETVRDVTGRMLRRLGLSVLMADNGRDAVKLYHLHQFDIDIVLLDMTMPQMNGEETLRELRKINPDVRAILASGYSESDTASHFMKHEIAGCLQKPYSLEKLRTLFAQVMSATRIPGENEKTVLHNKT